MANRRICVFTGSSSGVRLEYTEAARSLGKMLADRGLGLVYGGASVGLMATVANAVLQHGGHVTGVIPEAWRPRDARRALRNPDLGAARDSSEALWTAEHRRLLQPRGPLPRSRCGGAVRQGRTSIDAADRGRRRGAARTIRRLPRPDRWEVVGLLLAAANR